MQTDPLVANLAQIGSLCPEYVSMLALVENRTPPREIAPDSELKMIEGYLQEFGVVQHSSGDRLLCRDSAVYVPKSARENILRTLHLCHHAPGSMIQNTKGRIYWPEMRKQIHQVYTSCVECSTAQWTASWGEVLSISSQTHLMINLCGWMLYGPGPR